MKNRDHWTPSKYRLRAGRLRASHDRSQVAIGSWLITDAVAESYGESIPRYVAGKLIDLGCGKAPLFEAYRRYVTDVVWVDWAGSRHQNPDLDMEVDLNGPLPFATGEFDTIILSDVLEHIGTPERLFLEMARILAPGGRILMNVPFLIWVHESPHDYYRFTEFALRRFADASGLEVILLRPVGGSPEVFADLLAKHFQFVPVIGHFLAWSTQAVAKGFHATGIGKRVSDRSGQVFPLGYFMVAERPGIPRTDLLDDSNSEAGPEVRSSANSSV
jgi:SAM-dependent methyltransferase